MKLIITAKTDKPTGQIVGWCPVEETTPIVELVHRINETFGVIRELDPAAVIKTINLQTTA